MRCAILLFLTHVILTTSQFQDAQGEVDCDPRIHDDKGSIPEVRLKPDRIRGKRAVLLLVPGTEEENDSRSEDAEDTTRRNQKAKRCKAPFRKSRISMAISSDANKGVPKPRKNIDSIYEADSKEHPEETSLELVSLTKPKPPQKSFPKSNLRNREGKESSGSEESLLLRAIKQNLKSRDYETAAYSRRARAKLSVIDDGKYICYCREKFPGSRKRLDQDTPLRQTWTRKEKTDKSGRKAATAEVARRRKPGSVNDRRIGPQRLPILYSDGSRVAQRPASSLLGSIEPGSQQHRKNIPYAPYFHKMIPSQSNFGFGRHTPGVSDSERNINVQAVNRSPCPPIVGQEPGNGDSRSEESEESLREGPFDGNLLDYDECMKLYGRDVCVISATRSQVKQGQDNSKMRYYPPKSREETRMAYEPGGEEDYTPGYYDFTEPNLAVTAHTITSYVGTTQQSDEEEDEGLPALSETTDSESSDIPLKDEAFVTTSDEEERNRMDDDFALGTEHGSDENSESNRMVTTESWEVSEEGISENFESTDVTVVYFTSESSIVETSEYLKNTAPLDETNVASVDKATRENEADDETGTGEDMSNAAEDEMGKFPDESEAESGAVPDSVLGKGKASAGEESLVTDDEEDPEAPVEDTSDYNISTLENVEASDQDSEVTDFPRVTTIQPIIERPIQDLPSTVTPETHDAPVFEESSTDLDENVAEVAELTPATAFENTAIDNEEPGQTSETDLPFCDNSLIHNAIKSAINSFASESQNANEETDENADSGIVGAANDGLLPEILKVPNLKGILSISQVEDTIVNKVRDILSRITSVSKSKLGSDWASKVIKDNLRHITAGMTRANTELPPLAVEEHHFRNGVWSTDLVTLAPSSSEEVGSARSKKLRESIRGILFNPEVNLRAAEKPMVKNMIVASVRNSLRSADDSDNIYDDSMVRETLENMMNQIAVRNRNEGRDELINAEKGEEDEFGSESEPDLPEDVGARNTNNDYEEESDLSILRKIIDSSTLPDVGDIEESTVEVFAERESGEVQSKAAVDTQQAQKATSAYREVVSTAKNPEEKDISIYSGETSTEEVPASAKLHEEETLETTVPSAENFGFRATASPSNYESSEEPGGTDVVKMTEVSLSKIANYGETSTGSEVISGISSEILSAKSENIQNASGEMPNSSLTSTELEGDSDSSSHELNIANPATTDAIDHNTDIVRDVPTGSTKYYHPTDRLMNYIKNHQPDAANENPELAESRATDSSNESQSQNLESAETNGKANSSDQENNNKKRFKDSKVKGEERDSGNYKVGNNEEQFEGSGLVEAELEADPKAEVPEDFAYFGRISVEKKKENSDDFQSLQNSDLFYVGDGVKLPLEIRKLSDGSYALSISRKICEYILNKECPCCVPLKGNIVRTVKIENEEQSKPGLNKRAKRGAVDQSLRIISMPVEAFAKKYNLSLTLEEAQGNVKNKDEVKSVGDDASAWIKRKVRVEKNYPVDFNTKDSRMTDEDDSYENDEYGKFRYQRNTDSKPGTKIITNILHWLKDILVSKDREIVFKDTIR